MKKQDYEILKQDLNRVINFGFKNNKAQTIFNNYVANISDLEYNSVLKKLHKDGYVSKIELQDFLVKKQ